MNRFSALSLTLANLAVLSCIGLCHGFGGRSGAAASLSTAAYHLRMSSTDETSNVLEQAKLVYRNRDRDEDDRLIAQELARCDRGMIIDPHLHTAPWFDTADKLVEELERNDVSIGLLYNPYPKVSLPYDINEYVTTIAENSNNRVFALASLNTTHDDWNEHRVFEMNRLATFLEKDVVLGAKLAPPHTCLSLNSPIIDDVVETVSKSSKKLLAIHIGTTPFCGPLGKQFNVDCRCDRDYVNPELLLPYVQRHPDVRFVLLHSGHEFLPPDSLHFYNFEMVDKCIAMARQHPNVWLSISAIFAQEPDGTLKYPGGDEIVRKMKEAGVTKQVFWGSDASWFQGQIKPVLATAIRSMIKAGYTEEERTWALHGAAKTLFNFPVGTTK